MWVYVKAAALSGKTTASLGVGEALTLRRTSHTFTRYNEAISTIKSSRSAYAHYQECSFKRLEGLLSLPTIPNNT